MDDTQADVEVTQADRDAAYTFRDANGLSAREDLQKPLVKLLAKHRLTTLQTGREQALEEAWRPIDEAPKDGTRVLLFYAPQDREYRLHRHCAGRVFEGWHEGKTPSGYDLGWALYPGFGGVSDRDISGWQPLPEPPALKKDQTS